MLVNIHRTRVFILSREYSRDPKLYLSHLYSLSYCFFSLSASNLLMASRRLWRSSSSRLHSSSIARSEFRWVLNLEYLLDSGSCLCCCCTWMLLVLHDRKVSLRQLWLLTILICALLERNKYPKVPCRKSLIVLWILRTRVITEDTIKQFVTSLTLTQRTCFRRLAQSVCVCARDNSGMCVCANINKNTSFTLHWLLPLSLPLPLRLYLPRTRTTSTMPRPADQEMCCVYNVVARLTKMTTDRTTLAMTTGRCLG